MLYYVGKMLGTCYPRNINEILTHSFQIPVNDFLAMEIFNAMCDIKSLDKATITNTIQHLWNFLTKETQLVVSVLGAIRFRRSKNSTMFPFSIQGDTRQNLISTEISRK
jgi:hypothetical protein